VLLAVSLSRFVEGEQIGSTARSLGYSPTRCATMFRRAFGVGPKALARSQRATAHAIEEPLSGTGKNGKNLQEPPLEFADDQPQP
jgi:methylphosphotriester-DNA--protein-cysteine methyltransferase